MFTCEEQSADWLATVNAARNEKELSAVRRSAIPGGPLGEEGRVKRTAKRVAPAPADREESTLRPRARPKKIAEE